MTKIFVSLPVAGRTKDEIQKARKQAEVEAAYVLHTKDIEFIDTWIYEDAPEYLEGDRIGLWYLGKSLEKLTKADAIYCARGWTSFRGCIIEHDAAKFYGIKVLTYSNYLAMRGYNLDEKE